ncbi:MAG: LptF/LptG family permease [Flavobacteriales bacterium]|nr:LptF/LptG family permease [Flavobacteriales bacterium]
MLKTLDRYIIRQFLGTFFFILVLIMAIAVVFDISEKTEDFAKMKATWQVVVVEYYLNFVVYYANLFSGLLIFIAVILFTGRLSHRTEVVAILSSGISFPRFLRPYFIAASILCLISLVVNHYALPEANRVRLAFEEAHIRNPFRIDASHLHRDIGDGSLAYFEKFNWQQRTGYRFSMEQWENGVLKAKLLSDRAVYDSVNGRWTVYDFMVRTLDGEQEHVRHGQQLDTLINLKPEDLGRRNENATSMSDAELDTFIEEETRRGSPSVVFYRIEKHQRTSYPFATYVFTLIGVSIASRKVRGGTGVHLALGVLLILLYVFAMKITTVAATNAGFDPFTAVWLPNIVFGLVGVGIYRKAPK